MTLWGITKFPPLLPLFTWTEYHKTFLTVWLFSWSTLFNLTSSEIYSWSITRLESTAFRLYAKCKEEVHVRKEKPVEKNPRGCFPGEYNPNAGSVIICTLYMSFVLFLHPYHTPYSLTVWAFRCGVMVSERIVSSNIIGCPIIRRCTTSKLSLEYHHSITVYRNILLGLSSTVINPLRISGSLGIASL